MARNRPWRTLAATIIVVALSCAPTADAKPTSPLCDSGTYREAHPLICDTGATAGAPGSFPGGGGGRGGLLGIIRDVVDSLPGIGGLL